MQAASLELNREPLLLYILCLDSVSAFQDHWIDINPDLALYISATWLPLQQQVLHDQQNDTIGSSCTPIKHMSACMPEV